MTESQLNLLGKPDPTVDVQLTIRQRFVFDHVCNTAGGLTADEVGALLHARRGKHSVDLRCRFCASDGSDVLRSKALKPLLRRVRATGVWLPRDPELAAHVPDGSSEDVPF